MKTHIGCELSSVFEQISSTDGEQWTWFSKWVTLQCLSKSELLTRTPETQLVSGSPAFEQIRTTDKNGWTWSSLWVHPQCLSCCRSGWQECSGCELLSSEKLEPLIRMAEHTSSLWVTLLYLRSVPLMKMLNMIQRVSCASNVWAIQNHWQEYMLYSGCELLFSL